jgi:shikimate kinase
MSACRRIVLIGFMGAGKSTVAEILAGRLGWECIDLDAKLEAQLGKTVPQIFSDHGEPHFRRMESAALAELLSGNAACVIAMGGGAIESEANRTLLQQAGPPLGQTRVFYLEAPLEALLERCSAQHGDIWLQARPLLQHSELLFQRRAALYAAVGSPVSTFGFTAQQVASHVLGLLQIEGALPVTP